MPEETKIKQKYMAIGQAAKYLGVSKDTLRRWEKAGKIACHRTPGDRRRYLKEDLDKVLEGGVIRPYRKKILEPSETPERVRRSEAPKPSPPTSPKPEASPEDSRHLPDKSLQQSITHLAKDKKPETAKLSIVERSKMGFKNLFGAKEDNLPTHYISTPSGPRKISIRKPKLHTFTNKFRFISIHTIIFISVLVTTALATILIFYTLFQGELPKIKTPKIGAPKIGKETSSKDKILSPVP